MHRLWTRLLGAFMQVGLLSAVAPVCANEAQAYFTVNALADEAQDYYATNVEALVQGKCIVCHRAGGQAASSGADLLFTSSVASNHAAFDDYVNTPSQGARAGRVLSKITGALGHGGGRVIAPGSSDYDVFEQYMELVSAEDEPPNTAIHVLRWRSQWPIRRIQGWVISAAGQWQRTASLRVTILIDGVYAFDAPYGGARGDVGGAFPDVPNATDSGFSSGLQLQQLCRRAPIRSQR